MRRQWPLACSLLAAAALAGCEEGHGFLKVGSAVLLNDTDTLACGEAKIAPSSGGLVDAFVTLKPQDCMLKLNHAGSWFGTELCAVHIGNNRITSVYLTENIRGGLSCGIGNG